LFSAQSWMSWHGPIWHCVVSDEVPAAAAPLKPRQQMAPASPQSPDDVHVLDDACVYALSVLPVTTTQPPMTTTAPNAARIQGRRIRTCSAA
jgi:hypothetical protein